MANKLLTFSIITPSFNQVPYLKDTMDSVLSQAGNFNIEYIVADGGSTDGSVDIIKNYEDLLKKKRFPLKCRGAEFKWWSHADNGQSDAINQGFRTATGDFVAWLNSDDVYEPGVFAEALKTFNKHPDADLIYGNYSEIDSRGKLIRKVPVATFDIKKEIDEGNMIPQPSTFMRRKALLKVGLLNEKYHYAMDYDLWIRLGLKSKVIYVNNYWSRFRLHDTSKTVALEKNFWKEEREISRKNGAPFISQHLINHYHKTSPALAFLLVKSRNALQMLKRGQFPLVIKRTFQNLVLAIIRRK